MLIDLEFPDGFQRYKIAYTNTFGKPPWFDAVAQEYAACREAIGLSDYSSFTKIDLWVTIQRLVYLSANKLAIKYNILHFCIAVERYGSRGFAAVFVLERCGCACRKYYSHRYAKSSWWLRE